MAHDPDGFDALVRPHADALLELIDVHEATLTRRQLTPAPDAPLMAQIAEQRTYAVPTASTPIDQALSLGVHYTLAGCDHARSICTLVTAEPAVIYADKVLLRSAVEAFARAAWMLDPSASTSERVRRLVNEILHSYERTAPVAKRADRSEGTDESGTIGERIGELTLAAFDGGLGEIRRTKRGGASIGEPRPTATAVIGGLLDAEADIDAGATVQAFYSEFVHSNMTGLLSQVVTLDDDEGRPATGDLLLRPLASSADDVQQTLQFAATGLLVAGSTMRTLFGWHELEWAEAIRRAWPILRSGGLAGD